MIKQFSAFECAAMFNVDCNPQGKVKSAKVRYIEEPYAMNDINVPLWTFKKRRVSKRVRPMFDDNIKPGITEHEPGKGRVADLVKFYAEHAANEESAFDI